MSPAKRWLVLLAVAGLAAFALMGGEYSTLGLYRLKGQLQDEQEAIAQLKVAIDSLQRVDRAVRTDPRAQERIAREEFGMIRQGEYLYRVVPGDTVSGER
ncbi:MAG TPA: septum formation initiator family protein [Gemmatimonadales bacterium]|nr:septum formation initiator family protein [Gemmatimonadales bacterium]